MSKKCSQNWSWLYRRKFHEKYANKKYFKEHIKLISRTKATLECLDIKKYKILEK